MQRMLAAAICSILLCSCAMEQGDAVVSTAETLRAEAARLARGTAWSAPLEGDRLAANISTINGVQDGIELNPETISVSRVSCQTVYPYIKGFGSLDTRRLPYAVRQALDTFCAAVKDGKDIETFMSAGQEYAALFFVPDLCEAFGITAVPSSSDGEALFDDVLYGEPFFDGDDIIITMRLYRKGLYVDVEAGLVLNASDTSDNRQIKITQLRIKEAL